LISEYRMGNIGAMVNIENNMTKPPLRGVAL